MKEKQTKEEIAETQREKELKKKGHPYYPKQAYIICGENDSIDEGNIKSGYTLAEIVKNVEDGDEIYLVTPQYIGKVESGNRLITPRIK